MKSLQPSRKLTKNDSMMMSVRLSHSSIWNSSDEKDFAARSGFNLDNFRWWEVCDWVIIWFRIIPMMKFLQLSQNLTRNIFDDENIMAESKLELKQVRCWQFCSRDIIWLQKISLIMIFRLIHKLL